MPARDVSPDASLDPAPAGITELGIDIIKVDRIRRSLEQFGSRFSDRVLTAGRAALCARSGGDDGRPLGGQGGRVEGARTRRARHRLA